MTLAVLLCALTLAAGPAQQRGVPESEPARASRLDGPRLPLDVSLSGLGGRSRLQAPPTIGGVARFACAAGVEDQAGAGCLRASSIATSGLLFPYPGVSNVFAGPAFVGGGQGNQATGPWATVAGGRYNAASGSYATVAGGNNNGAALYATTVAGGVFNSASFYYATVGGGSTNAVPGFGGTVGGGRLNTASGLESTIAGGGCNTAAGGSATVGGGLFNEAPGYYATVGGGGGPYAGNIASGDAATVPGGQLNAATGDFSFAAGRRAKANHTGAFVWGDGLNANKTSSSANQFNVYCSGGARFFSNGAASTGVLLAPGGGSWSSVSDRDSKENVVPVDGRAVLARVAALPLATWNYKAQDEAVRHMGPMAQDFHAAFGLGVNDRVIDTVDPDGVALAAIQGLNAIVEESEARLARKEAELAALRARQAGLEARLEELTRRVEELAASR